VASEPLRYSYLAPALFFGSTPSTGIAQVPSGDGSGMQWIAIMPLGLVFLVLTLPALIFALSGFLLRFAIGLGIAGLVAFALLWNELLKEFYH